MLQEFIILIIKNLNVSPGSLPIIDESISSRPDSDTPSNDSGSALTDEDTPTEQKKFRLQDLLDDKIPSAVPSPSIEPDMMTADLIKFEPPQGNNHGHIV